MTATQTNTPTRMGQTRSGATGNGDIHAARMARIERMADRLDSRFRIPGTGIRFGWDSLLGLIPGVGDVVSLAPAGWMMVEAYRMGARKRTLARMGANTALDVTVGGIPILGDVFDVFFKSNRRNLALLQAETRHRTARA